MRAKKHFTKRHLSLNKRVPNKRWRWKALFFEIIAWLGIIFLLGVIFYGLFFSDFLRVSSIEVLGTDELDNGKIDRLTRLQMEGKYLKFIEKDNFILINTERIKTAILGEFRKIEELDIKKKFPNKLVLSIRERESAIILCGKICYVLDMAGKIYDEAIINEGEDQSLQKISILRDGANENFQLQESVLDSAYIQYINGIKERLNSDLEIEIERELFTPWIISGDIRVKTKEGWSVYFDKSISLEKEIAMLRAVLKNKIEKEKRSDLEYIDLRMDNKVYYKYKTSPVFQEEQPSTEEPLINKTESEKKKKKD